MSEKLTTVKIVDAALHETKSGEITLVGAIAPESLHILKTDDYQREVAPLTSLSDMRDAIKAGETLPPVELGMRGQNFTSREGTFFLKDPTFIIDGIQRISSAVHVLNTNPGTDVHISCQVRFNTTKEEERELFRKLNTLRTKVSPNVILRNRRSDSPAVLMLYGLTTNDKIFALHGRVTWSQRMGKGELITALTFAKVFGLLHSHKAATKRSRIEELVPALDKAIDAFGISAVRDNIKKFFELVDECWGIKRVHYREGAMYMRHTFLAVLAKLLSDHHDFWQAPDEKRLFVSANLKRKIAQFEVNDPAVIQLTSSSGKSRELLYMLLRDHINKGKTTKRLSPRDTGVVASFEEDEEEDRKAA